MTIAQYEERLVERQREIKVEARQDVPPAPPLQQHAPHTSRCDVATHEGSATIPSQTQPGISIPGSKSSHHPRNITRHQSHPCPLPSNTPSCPPCPLFRRYVAGNPALRLFILHRPQRKVRCRPRSRLDDLFPPAASPYMGAKSRWWCMCIPPRSIAAASISTSAFLTLKNMVCRWPRM